MGGLRFYLLGPGDNNNNIQKLKQFLFLLNWSHIQRFASIFRLFIFIFFLYPPDEYRYSQSVACIENIFGEGFDRQRVLMYVHCYSL